ncbi:MAG: glutamine--fructose-6-phosphate transaminase (isomerizing) [Candidatus Marinimicrobia bacterium]|nr:glutamine--fructose-6-phosphate transaminase (isomerizing) [Candidatus Neomarinimicrobiota bacterium]MCF7904442.1 glutamine--fructose-6-phosphate transaminase (isomerizing) [Candidatus Neomarinimicrobiota bacterium]
MCGIVGYIGKNNAIPIVVEGLQRLEYRGYDSCGVALIQDAQILIEKVTGKVNELQSALAGKQISADLAIGHTRWATHGSPTQKNAHPHLSQDGKVAVVHNGIIENYKVLKDDLTNKGYIFNSETDTEIIAALVSQMYDGNLEKAVRKALALVVGAYGIAVMHADEPEKIVCSRNGAPLIMAVGEQEYFVASDVAAVLNHSKDVIYLDNQEIGVITKDGINTLSPDDVQIDKEIHKVTFDLEEIEKSGYEHFMLKEIFSQPQTIYDAMRGRLQSSEGNVHLGGIDHVIGTILNADQRYLTACGTSWHAALIGEMMFEQFARLPSEVEYASEFRYREPLVDAKSVVFAISQSGETADTLAAIQEAKQKDATVLGICNVVGSSIARETEAGVYIHAGPEIGVASTKAFTSQVTVLSLLTLKLARMMGMSEADGIRIAAQMEKLPEDVEWVLKQADKIAEIAKIYAGATNFLYLGRGVNFPVALEGALKLKEISYIHAEGYPAAEMKHGPIALIDESMPVVAIAPQDKTYDKIISNIEEVKARNGSVIALATEGDKRIKDIADHVLYVPPALTFTAPILNVIPLQLLSYYIAVERGCDVDQPRNLAKSVTVE